MYVFLCVALLGAASFDLEFAVQKFKDLDIQNYNSAFCMGVKLGR